MKTIRYSDPDLSKPFAERVDVEMLREVQQCILNNPDHLDMKSFGYTKELAEIAREGQDHINCETAGCISGWAVAVAYAKVGPEAEVVDAHGHPLNTACGEIVLGLTNEESSLLFFMDNWPMSYRWPYDEAMSLGNHEEAAQAVSDYIDHFIENEGVVPEPTLPPS